jgi:dTMP kinase
MRTGLFLSLDGIDGTGKSTQSRLLADRLRASGRTVTTCSDPGGTELGARIRELLLFGREHHIGMRTEALLVMASRAELVDQVIRPALDRGDVVVSDRFLLANVVYQGHAGGIDPALLWKAGELSTGGLIPDLTIVLDAPIAVARGRMRRDADRVESRPASYHDRVRAGFLAEASRDPHRYRVVDASGSAGQVHESIWQIVAGILPVRTG